MVPHRCPSSNSALGRRRKKEEGGGEEGGRRRGNEGEWTQHVLVHMGGKATYTRTCANTWIVVVVVVVVLF
jgi:hypothetical protein